MNVESKYIQLIALANRLEIPPEQLIDLGISRELKILVNKDFYACTVSEPDWKTTICGNVSDWFFLSSKDLKGFYSKECIYCDALYDAKGLPFIPRLLWKHDTKEKKYKEPIFDDKEKIFLPEWSESPDIPEDIVLLKGGIVKIQIKKEELYLFAEEASREEKKYLKKCHDKEATDILIILALVQLLEKLSDLTTHESIFKAADNLYPINNTTFIFALVQLLRDRSILKTQESILKAVNEIITVSKTTFTDRLRDARKLINPKK